MNKLNNFYRIIPTLIFLLALNTFSEAKKESALQHLKPGCYNAPIYIYDENLRKYYRQDWCKSSKQPVYFDAIPVPTERGERRLS